MPRLPLDPPASTKILIMTEPIYTAALAGPAAAAVSGTGQ